MKALITALGAAKEGKEERKMKEAATGTLFNLSGYDQVKLQGVSKPTQVIHFLITRAA